MKKINILLVFCLLTNLFVFQSCQKKDSHIEIVSIPELDEKKTNHEWFYFNGKYFISVGHLGIFGKFYIQVFCLVFNWVILGILCCINCLYIWILPPHWSRLLQISFPLQ